MRDRYRRDTRSGVTDAGMKDIGTLRTLVNLDLTGTKVTDAGLRKLAVLDDLAYLDLTGTKVMHAGVKALQEALAKCRIVR